MLNFEIYNNGSENWVVFIHGIGGSTMTWKKQIEAFSENYNLLLIDLPGHGKSHDDGEYNISAKKVNKEIKNVLDELQIKKADFVCLSLGTLVVAKFAVKYPEYVNSIIFGGAVIQVDGIYKFLMHATNKIKRLLPHKAMYKMFAHAMMPKANHKRSRMIFIRESLKMKRQSFMSWIEYMTEITHPQKLLDKLKKLNIQMIFISGDEDTFFIKGTKKVASILKTSKIKIIQKCGHVCTIERYKEFNAMALDFLSTVHKKKIPQIC